MLVGALALTGCGGGQDTAAFADDYLAVTEDYRTALQDAQTAGAAASGGASTVSVYAQLRDETQKAAEGFRQLDAPDDTAQAVDDLTAELEAQVEALDRVLAAADDQDAAAVNAALADYAAALGAWQEAHARVDAAHDDTDPARAGP